MALNDPRNGLPPPTFQNQRPVSYPLDHRRSFRHKPFAGASYKVRKLPCYDWIFSSATNVHIAIDKSAFKSFTHFDSYVLRIADQRPIPVKGIGKVELKIRCKPGSRDSRTITLDDVLYVPSWVCNIFSDVYFEKSKIYEHKWDQFGVHFTRYLNGKKKPWGYTENFCGQDRLIVARKADGRSPMLEDKDREVWSVNLKWPQGQQDKWDRYLADQIKQEAIRKGREIRAQASTKYHSPTESTELLLPKNPNMSLPENLSKSKSAPFVNTPVKSTSEQGAKLANVLARQVSVASLDLQARGGRMSLNEINKSHAVKTEPEMRVSSLRATLNANRGLLRDLVTSPTKTKEVVT